MSNSIDTALLLNNMPQVLSYHNNLCNLADWWRKVALLGKINSLQIAVTLMEDMEATRKKFESLQSQLIENLVKVNLKKLDQELNALAQVSIDILIRNLFERTADVGFLATDDDLRAFLSCQETDSQQERDIVHRLHEYTQKYSVYDEIIILEPSGRVRVHLDEENNPISHSTDPLIRETLATHQPYVETFRHSDLQPKQKHSLIYSARITETNDARSKVLGVLCLCFRFDDEMTGIFNNLRKGNEIIAILDQSNRVISSSAPLSLKVDDKVETISSNKSRLIKLKEEEYIARTTTTKGYQGFTGLSWQGHTMVPLRSAFVDSRENTIDSEQLLSTSQLFSDELQTISSTATTVTDDLILVVLNGQIVSAKKDAKEFMPVLDEIRNIGHQTKGVFKNSVTKLYETVVSSLLSEIQFQALLAVDIMDRNLYERANDVRWWALTTRFREILDKPDLSADDQDTLSSILAYINELYTVYTNLFLFDNQGEILAVSNQEEASLVGTKLPPDAHYKQALGVQETQSYIVSPFESTMLYGNRHTYIYLTSVKSLSSQASVGGIGIVFDSEPQFTAMLEDALPRDDKGNMLEGAFGIFANRNGVVISSTNEQYQVGDSLELEQQFFELENGERHSALVEFQGQSYAIGAAMSQGYREYKTTGDYENDVIGLIFVPV